MRSGDQRGVTRPLDGDGDGEERCDIGAFELPEPSALSLQLAGALAVLALAGKRRADR